jgi:hypothetical protein
MELSPNIKSSFRNLVTFSFQYKSRLFREFITFEVSLGECSLSVSSPSRYSTAYLHFLINLCTYSGDNAISIITVANVTDGNAYIPPQLPVLI